MLTVDFDRLDLRPGMRLLDLGCGQGRHAFEGLRRGARVVALDRNAGDCKDTAAAMAETGNRPASPAGAPASPTPTSRATSRGFRGWLPRESSAPPAGDLVGSAGPRGWAVNGDGVALPFADGSFDRVIAAEILEHVDDDRAAMAELVRVLRPGGRLAATVPRWFPEKVCWALDEGYHAPAVPGGHVRIYRRSELTARLRDAGLRVLGSHHAHSLHAPYWWLKCAVGVGNDDHPAVRRYHGFLVGEIFRPRPAVTRLERALNPVIGKSLVVYACR